MIQVWFKKLNPNAVLPQYQSLGASGMDLCGVEKVVLKKGEIVLVSTGLQVEIPEGYELQLRARSGLAAKQGVFLVNGVGTIDSDYRGEIKVILSTCKEGEVVLQAGDRICQAVLTKVEKASCVWEEELSSTARASGGFGSTGLGSALKPPVPLAHEERL